VKSNKRSQARKPSQGKAEVNAPVRDGKVTAYLRLQIAVIVADALGTCLKHGADSSIAISGRTAASVFELWCYHNRMPIADYRASHSMSHGISKRVSFCKTTITQCCALTNYRRSTGE
jgi:hypothetical protein